MYKSEILTKFAFRTKNYTIMKKQVLLFVLMLMPLVASAQIEINGIYYHLNSIKNMKPHHQYYYQGNSLLHFDNQKDVRYADY